MQPLPVSPAMLARGLMMPLLVDPAFKHAHRALAEYLVQAASHDSLEDMLLALARIEGAGPYLRHALYEACASPDAMLDAIAALESLIIQKDRDKIAAEEKFGTNIRALLLLVKAGSFERVADLYDATVSFCSPQSGPATRTTSLPRAPSRASGEAQQALSQLHAYFDVAAREALLHSHPSNPARAALEAEGHPPRSTALIQHAILQLCLLHEELGHTAEALLAAHEAILVAHQQGDESTLKQAIAVLRRLEAAAAATEVTSATGLEDDWDLFGYASLAVLMRKDELASVSNARITRGADVDRLVGAKPVKDAAGALRLLQARLASEPTAAEADDSLVTGAGVAVAHRLACLLGDFDAAKRISDMAPWVSTADEVVLQGGLVEEDDVHSLLLRARVLQGRGRGTQLALRAWSQAHEKGWATVKAVAQLSLATAKLRADRADDALALVLEVAPHIAAHASLVHQGQALLLEVKCRLATGTQPAAAVLPLLGEAVRKLQEACWGEGLVEALYLSARVLHECGRTSERDKVAARWQQARRRLQKPSSLEVAAGDAILARSGSSGLEALIATAAQISL